MENKVTDVSQNARLIFEIKDKKFAEECHKYLQEAGIHTYYPCPVTNFSLNPIEAQSLYQYAEKCGKSEDVALKYYVCEANPYATAKDTAPSKYSDFGYRFDLYTPEMNHYTVQVSLMENGVRYDYPKVSAPAFVSLNKELAGELENAVLLAVATDYIKGLGGHVSILPDGYDTNAKLRDQIANIQFTKTDIYENLSIATNGKFDKSAFIQFGLYEHLPVKAVVAKPITSEFDIKTVTVNGKELTLSDFAEQKREKFVKETESVKKSVRERQSEKDLPADAIR
jgi:hypothetical protein